MSEITPTIAAQEFVSLGPGEPAPPTERTRTVSLFALLMGAATLLGLVKGIVFAKVLGVQGLGYYGLVLLVSQFGVYLASWGILSALNNQLPVIFGRGDHDVDELVGRSLGALLLTIGITSTVYLLVVAAISPTDPNVWLALSLAAVMTAVTTICEFYFLLLRVERLLMPLAFMYLIRSVGALGLGVITGSIWGWRGVVASELGALIVAIAIARQRWLPKVRPYRPTRQRTLWLIRWGAPLLFANMIVTLTFTADRMFVAGALPAELGQYVFASLVVIAWTALLGVLAQAMAPQLLFEYGTGTPLARVRAKAVRLTTMLAVAGIGGLVALIALQGWLARGYFSAYAAGLHAMPILYLGGLVSMIAFPGFILGVTRPGLSSAAAGLSAVVAVGGGALLAATGASLDAFAWLFTVSQVVRTVAVLLAVEFVVRRMPLTALPSRS